MYNYIKGIITSITSNYIVLENNNIGYNIRTPNPFSFKENDEIKIHTYLHVREDIQELYGFKTAEEKELFLKLLSVKGIGPKGALAIVANGDVNRLEEAIINADIAYLRRFPGVGAKASSQIILDLQGKLATSKDTNIDPKLSNVKEALKSLGYSNQELKKIDNYLNNNKSLPIETLIKESLKKLV
ncbi:MAG: Holliday junction branch migration protein RuvA [Bacilli bacterium]